MATDVDVQFFSHLNGLVLSNNWGDLIRLLDTCLVNGLPLTAITSATIDAQGDLNLSLYAEHKALLFQVIELQGFVPASINGKYRIKGIPDSKTFILKAELKGQTITTTGTAKLASLGYEIIFRDPNDVKRVYRAKNPTAQHPFIRVDESLASNTGSYTSTYAKYAMVGLLEHMEHIDDYENPDVLQLPFDPADPAKNWKITGTGASCIRGWSKWYWARAGNAFASASDSSVPTNGNRQFTLCGNKDAFYYLSPYEFASSATSRKIIYGAGLFNADSDQSPWFLMSLLTYSASSYSYEPDNLKAGTPLSYSVNASQFLGLTATPSLKHQVYCLPILPDYQTGYSNVYSNSNAPALEIPFYDDERALRGSLKHVYYSGLRVLDVKQTTVLISGNSMYAFDGISLGSPIGIVYFYLGDLEL
ncbi:hypothetical protein NVV27_01905 [Acinetobacter radioresistens]|uniref:hypothetical protein n=1 Tax=Acinetobacter radioresistens TaxID=40216 RepID=UPI002247EE5B|nr:hypothetical protein [Acinetobacter radioresistens]MCX0344491.1 hypothetical protein [Acinetobacter radioresistens]